ncbi:hypothetical protein QJR52_04545 [Clostridium baratii]|uniref:hypothetical protein n=1 Tax=Clostridium baratii TaxID=1561 RepID=UPI0030D06551
MSVKVNDSKGLGEALKADEDEIIIEGDLKEKVIRIKAKGKVAWAVAIGAIAVAVVAIIATPATGGTSSIAAVATAPAAVSVLGGAATTAAISIAVAAGGVGALNKLREYKIVENDENKLVLRK